MKIALVTPWFGPQLRGGAERIAWQAANGLADRGHDVSVLTTCSRSFSDDWSRNYYPPGTVVTGRMSVLRFRVRERNRERFNRVNQKLVALTPNQLIRGVSPVFEEEARTFVDENINSDALTDHLTSSPYDAVLFIPYLYGPILNGWKAVADRAFVQPCLHDEAYAYLPDVAEMMRGVRGLLFNSEGEREIASRLFGPGVLSHSTVVGSAVELKNGVSSNRRPIGGFIPEDERFFLYLGRRADTKNVSFLARVFRKYRQAFPDATCTLVLAGPGTVNYSDASAGIVDLGFISEEEKVRLLRACRALVQPSKNESYSRTMMESWLCARPVVVHSDCRATSRAVETTGAGWVAGSESQWIAVMSFVDRADEMVLDTVAGKAAHYVEKFASWPGVLDNYERALGAHLPRKVAGEPAPEVHQVLDAVEYGEVLTMQALAIRRALREGGYESRIFSKWIDSRMKHEAESGNISGDAIAIVHAHRSAAAAISLARCPNQKILIVHGALESLVDDLLPVAARYDAVYTTAESAREMLGLRAEISARRFAPIADPARWNLESDPTLMAALQDGKTNILSVHEIEPGNKPHEMLRMFAYYLSLDLNARLILAGRFDFEDPYYQELLQLVHGSALSQHVLITGLVSEPALAALYSAAHVYCTLSEKEHVGTTLVDAMWFDVPVVAFSTAGTRDILRDSGVLLKDKSDLLEVAALLRVVADDALTREAIVRSQRVRRSDFNSGAIRTALERMIASLESSVADQRA